MDDRPLPPDASLANRLRTDTRTLHAEAERSPFMAAMLRGRIGRPAYASLLRNLQMLYGVLESALSRHAALPALAMWPWPRYARADALARDLATLAEPGAEEAPQPATRIYVDRLRALSDDRPDLLLAHAYVRYLGDLSGGQILSRIVVANPRLGETVGTAFYDFGDASAVAALAATFRDGLDRAEGLDADALVAEAQHAFVLHRRLFEQLAAVHGVTVATPAGI